ncbi:MAG: hypothetical protein ACI8WT_003624 [Clostridium sp.]|jgi:hypothetical protein
MIDIETHRVIDLIPSRNCDEVVPWLKVKMGYGNDYCKNNLL